MRLIGRGLNLLSTGLAGLGALCIILMMLQVTADVALKNLFNYRLPFTQTLVTHWYMVGAAFLPLALTEILDRHISVEVMFQTLPPKVRRLLGGVVCLFAAAISGIMLTALWSEAVKKMHAGSFMTENGQDITTWGSYFFLPAGFALMLLVLLYRVLVLWTPLQSGMGEVQIDGPDETHDAMREGI